MDEESKHLLRSWGFEQLIDKFAEDEIGLENIKANAVSEVYLRPLLKPGPRFLLLSKIEEYAKKCRADESNPTNEDTPNDENEAISLDNLGACQSESEEDEVEPRPPPAKKAKQAKKSNSAVDFIEKRSNDHNVNRLIKNLDVHAVITGDSLAKVVLETYQLKAENNRHLDERGRKQIIRCVGAHLLSISKDLKNEHVLCVAEKLIKLFPSESLGTYYIAPKTYPNQDIAKGRLTYKYRNLKSAQSTLSKQEVNEAGPSRVLSSPQSDNPYQWILDYIEDPSITDERLGAEHWLRHQNSPWPEVLEKWRLTAPLRLQGLINTNKLERTAKRDTGVATEVQLLGKYFDTHTLLRHSSGYQLLCQDFDFIFKESANNLYLHWESFELKLLDLAKEVVTDKFGLSALTTLSDDTLSKETRTLTLLTLIPSVCQPQIKLKVAAGKLWKVSIPDSRQSFILQVNALADLRTAIKRRGEKLQLNKQRAQPFIAVVGGTKAYFCVDKVVYSCNNILSALESCYKSFFALHALYPPECEQVWLIIQRCLYRMETPYDNLGIAKLHEIEPRLK
ncbi:uncharacterized protein LOC117642456 [Thrips palmi]|uniref:Uncharacterized protein LOC117642456 n=1 Tax=Thrips palmi TaxID=161013 RepID=A0A6P8YHX3_THRPL|nr:uncharacterized protein LOC117642456 [Thrips palmi]